MEKTERKRWIRLFYTVFLLSGILGFFGILLYNAVTKVDYIILILIILYTFTCIELIQRVVSKKIHIAMNKETENGHEHREVISDCCSSEIDVFFEMFSMLTTISDLPFGFFKADIEQKEVYVSGYLNRMLGEKAEYEFKKAAYEKAAQLYGQLKLQQRENQDNVYSYWTEGECRWVEVFYREKKDYIYGVVLDITEEISEKKRIEFEMEAEPFANLYNRQFFIKKVQALIGQEKNKIGIMAYIDLDDVNIVNTQYSRDIGDEYVKKAARLLEKAGTLGGLAAKLPSDEFLVYLHGFHTVEEAEKTLELLVRCAQMDSFYISESSERTIGMTVGSAIYSIHSENPVQLVNYAEYAMDYAKKTKKGSIHMFQMDIYLKDAFLISKSALFDQLIQENRVQYAFQPIVDVKTGKVAAFEALMRPQLEDLRSPLEVLSIAESRSKLYMVEEMTYKNLLNWMAEHNQDLGGVLLFYNTIPNQNVLQGNGKLIELFQEYGSQMITEITEHEDVEESFIQQKLQTIYRYGGKIAIDDYGTGFSNNKMLLMTNPEYIKIDRSLITDIHKLAKKQQLLAGILAYAKQQQIKIIAEGVETQWEAKKLVDMGVDYIQGFYLSKPIMDLEVMKQVVNNQFVI